MEIKENRTQAVQNAGCVRGKRKPGPLWSGAGRRAESLGGRVGLGSEQKSVLSMGKARTEEVPRWDGEHWIWEPVTLLMWLEPGFAPECEPNLDG